MTRVEKLVIEKAELQKLLNELETFRRNIRLGDSLGIEESTPSRLRRMFRLGNGQLGDGQRKQTPAAIVSEFYRFTYDKSDEASARLNEINTELEAL